ncbi:MAG: ankyrin repeat domain-containing protein [Wolbachia sp.]|nr:ankyrin repeat domain-containing protein [Wolbachia sp.]MDD9336673.1 ankyrin repeat domain-containing protein [Wolbachia sp.]
MKNNIDKESKVKQLVKNGLDINTTKDGKTILDIAIEKKLSSQVVELLINNGSEISTIDSNGHTALHRSVQNKNIKVVKLLLETNKKGVDKFFLARYLPESIFVCQIEVNAEDKNGFTTLDYAKQSSEMYTLLQKYGAKHSKKFSYFHSLNIKELDLNKLVSNNDYCFNVLAKALEVKDETSRTKDID